MKMRGRIPEPLKMFITGFLMYVVTALPIIIWHGGLFFYYGDYNVQQVPFYVLAHRLVREGRFFWTFGLDLGGSLTGDMAFYLMGSPFFWITYPFPERMLPYMMPFLMALKYGTCACTAYLYIRRYTRTDLSAKTGALLFAFSGFNASNIVFNHFTDVVAFFPLLLLCFENLCALDVHPDGEPGRISEGFSKWLFFTLMVTLTAIINYYFFFGIVIFLLMYYAVMYAGSGSLAASVMMFVRALSAGIAGVMLAAFYLCLALDGVAGNSRLTGVLAGYDVLVYPSALMYLDILRSMIMVPDIIGKGTLFYFDTVRNASLAAYMPMFGLTGIFAFFMVKKGKKDRLKTLLIVCAVIAAVPFLNASFSLFNHQYYARWFYMPILIMATVTARMLERRDLAPMRKGVLMSTGLFAFCVAAIFLPVKDEDGNLKVLRLMENEKMFYRDAAVTAVLILILILLYFVVKDRTKRMKLTYFSTILAGVAMTMVMVFNGKTLISDFGMQKWQEQMLDTRPSLPTDSFYRIETDDTATNYEMVWGMPTMHCFLSTVPAEIFDFYEGAAGWRRTVESNPSLDRPGLRALLSARYFVWNSLINEDYAFGRGEGTYGYEQVSEQNGFTIFENRNYIPPGFTFDYFIRTSDWETLDKHDRDKLLVRAILLDDEDAGRFSHMLAEIPAVERDGFLDEIRFDQDCEARRLTACTEFREEESGFYAVTSDLPRENLVFFSVPAVPGFTVTVDGQETEMIKADYGMMAVRVPAGVHEIRGVYRPVRLTQGIVISLAGVVFVLGFFLFCRREESVIQ